MRIGVLTARQLEQAWRSNNVRAAWVIAWRLVRVEDGLRYQSDVLTDLHLESLPLYIDALQVLRARSEAEALADRPCSPRVHAHRTAAFNEILGGIVTSDRLQFAAGLAKL